MNIRKHTYFRSTWVVGFLILLITTLVVSPAYAAAINFTGEIDFVDLDSGGGVYSGTAIGTDISGLIDDVTFNGEITNGTTLTPFSCCIAAGGLSVDNNATLNGDDAALLNSLAGASLFNAGDTVDAINIEGDALTASGGRIEVGVSYIFDSSTFSDTSLNNYPFDPDDVLLGLFFIFEEDSNDLEIYSAIGHLAEAVVRSANLTGAAENPPVVTAATGRGAVVVNPTTMEITGGITFSGLTASLGGHHIHQAPSGEPTKNGPVIISLLLASDAVTAVVPPNTVLTQAQYDALLDGELYFNVHSTTYPGGEIRGQINVSGGVIAAGASLNGDQEVPAVTTNAMGEGTLVVDEVTRDIIISYVTHDVANTDGAHIHSGLGPGTNGGVIVTFSTLDTDFDNAGTNLAIPPAVTQMTAQDVANLLTDHLYFNIHSATNGNPGGEIRGDITILQQNGSPTRNVDIVIDFGASIGLYARMNDTNWLRLNPASPTQVVTGDVDGNGEDDVIAAFDFGIFIKYNLGPWQLLHKTTPQAMSVGDLDNNGQDDVVIDFGGIGLYARMNNTSWLRLNPASPTQVVTGDVDGNGADDVIAAFDFGTFIKYNLGAWQRLHKTTAQALSVGDLDDSGQDDVVIDFGAGVGLYARMNNASWLRLYNGSPDLITTGDIDGNGADDVVATFGSSVGGSWVKLNLGGWSRLSPFAADDIVTGDVDASGQDDVIASFGSTIGGVYVKRNQGAWSRLHNASPDGLATGQLDGN